jgi:PAS domain S-box-containing protein
MKLPALSLKYRIALVIFLLEALMMSIVLWQSLGLSSRATGALHAASEDVLLEVVEQVAGTALLTEEYSEPQLFVEKLGKQPTVEQILVGDIRNRVVISSDVSKIGLPMPATEDRKQLFWRTKSVSSPAGQLGTLAIRFNTTVLDEAASQALSLGASIAVAGMVVIAVVGILVGYALTRRLDAVAQTAAAFARGDRDVRSGVDGIDEIGELGRTFDAMIDQVATQQQRLEEVVQERTAKLKEQAEIIDQVTDAVMVVDLQGVITGWNYGGEGQLGYTAGEVLGQSVAMLHPESERASLWAKLMEPVIRNGSNESELPLQRKDGSRLYAHLSLSLLRDEQGKPKGIVGISTDVSERRAKDERLQQVMQQLQATNEELEAFSYSVSHDLRAPLRAVDGFSQALLEDYGDRLDDMGRDFLNRVRNGAQHMATLIDDMLQLSRVSRRDLQRETVDITQLALGIVDTLRAHEPERHVEVRIDEGMTARGDPGLLRIALENLIGNAWKYTAKAAAADIHVGRQSGPEGDVMFVRDNGVGFDMKYAGKLFGAFQRLHHADEFPGTGIGLATVKRILVRHGGRIWAESTPGKGATFFFTVD